MGLARPVHAWGVAKLWPFSLQEIFGSNSSLTVENIMLFLFHINIYVRTTGFVTSLPNSVKLSKTNLSMGNKHYLLDLG